LRTFEHVKLESLNFDLKSITTEQGRKYVTPEGHNFPSVTTILSDYGKKELFEWRKRVGDEQANKVARLASSRGTALHSVCEKYLLNEMDSIKIQSMMPTTKALFKQLREPLDENIGKVYCLEQALYSNLLQIAGRVDCIAEWKGKLAVIDFKSSSREKDEEKILNYFMQCTAYALMFQERTGIVIDDIVVAIGVEEGNGQIFERTKKPYIGELNKYISNYRRKLK
jgi:hypothetical protein